MKKSGRKLLGIMLAASMAVAAVFPVQGVAAEGRDSEYEYVEEEKASEGEGTAEDSGEEQKMPEEGSVEEPEEGKTPEETGQVQELEEGKTPEEARQVQELEGSKTPEEAGQMQELEESETPEEAGQEQSAEEDSQEPEVLEDAQPLAAGTVGEETQKNSYDINQPVIEYFELEENGQTLAQDDVLHFKMSVYDADGSIQSISVVLSGSYYYENALRFEKSEEAGNLYVAELPCSQLLEGNYLVYSIQVEDERSNYVNGKVLGEDGQYLYQFTRKNHVAEGNIALSNFKIEKNSSNEDGTLKSGDYVTYTASVQCENEEINDVNMCISTSQGTYSNSYWFEGKYHADSNLVTATYEVRYTTYPTVWGLEIVQIRTKSGKTYYFNLNRIEPGKDLTFTVNQEYDSAKPVIKSIVIDKNGQEVHVGDTVSIEIEVEEEHPNSPASVQFTPLASSSMSSPVISLQYDKDAQKYTGEIKITEFTYPGRWELTHLRVGDAYGNLSDLNDYKGELPLYYTVAEDAYDREKPVIKSIHIDNGQLVRARDVVTITVEVDEQNPYSTAEAWFEPEDLPYVSSQYAQLRYNKSLNAYVCNILITESTNPCRWNLTNLHIRDENGNETYLSDYEEDGPWYYTVDPEGYDVEGPVIKSITIDKNGQWVSAGDTVTIRVKVDEKNPSYSGSACFYPQVTNVSTSTCVELRYHEADQEYVGTIDITDDTYPCEWMLAGLDIRDELGHWASFNELQQEWYFTHPWYYRVKSGNTYREDVKDVTVNFHGFARQEDGSYQPNSLISSQTLENVGRRATLKELGVFPEPIEGVAAKWRYNGTGQEVDENTELLFNGTENMECDFWASYDKGCANVSLTYMAEGSGQKTVTVPQFIDREATYQDVLDALELPEDGIADGFVGFKLGYSNDYHNEDTQVGDVARVSVEAEYNNCQVSWNTKYVGKDGKEISRVITKSYLKGTKVRDALAELEEPEDASGMGLEGWILTGADGDEILSQSMSDFDVIAIYQGKTTAEVSYTYRGEDGKIAWGSKLMLMEGENLSDAAIQGEASDAFKEVEHLAGLMLSEWTSTVDIDQGKYKKVQFQALYYNCVVVLKYPDETCQYVVVNKNAQFTLPTENETYEDIVWEGYEKGQAVTITEDREFLAEDAKRKDGTKEEPKGARLSEEEIEKIKEEIEKAEDGTSIRIDMKKATVVPKEVLEAIKQKSVDIVLDMGLYSWSINGVDVVATDLKDIDLEVTIGTDTVPSSLIASIAEGKPATQISLTHNGEFGFRADLTLNLGSENSGSAANLYYYDSSGKLIFRNAGQVGADGTTSLSFSHASDYVVVIDKTASSDIGQKEETGEQENGTKEEGTGEQENSTKEENTGKQDDSIKEENTGKQDDSRKADTGKDNKADETANVKKNPDNTTTDSGKAETVNTDSDKMKSPKTGE